MAVTVAVKKAVIKRDGIPSFEHIPDRMRTAPNRVVEHSPGPNPQIGTSDWRAVMDSTQTCSIDGCDRAFSAKGMCSLHYQRAITGRPLAQPEKVIHDQCAVDSCDGRPRSKFATLCEKHYIRWYRTGSTDVRRPMRNERGICTIEGCGKTDSGPHGLCPMHKTRMDRHGDPTVKLKPHVRHGADNPMWTGDEASYSAVHLRLRKRRGAAKNQVCAECGARGAQWSYDREDAHERQAPEGPYSTDLTHYRALCIPCHKAFDLEAIRAHL